jgi:hypothetical protein
VALLQIQFVVFSEAAKAAKTAIFSPTTSYSLLGGECSSAEWADACLPALRQVCRFRNRHFRLLQKVVQSVLCGWNARNGQL